MKWGVGAGGHSLWCVGVARSRRESLTNTLCLERIAREKGEFYTTRIEYIVRTRRNLDSLCGCVSGFLLPNQTACCWLNVNVVCCWKLVNRRRRTPYAFSDICIRWATNGRLTLGYCGALCTKPMCVSRKYCTHDIGKCHNIWAYIILFWSPLPSFAARTF